MGFCLLYWNWLKAGWKRDCHFSANVHWTVLWINVNRKSIGSKITRLPNRLQLSLMIGCKKSKEKIRLSNSTTFGQKLKRIQRAEVEAVCNASYFCIIGRILRINTVPYTYAAVCPISCYVHFNGSVCQMTPRTEEPSHNRWQRLKLACPWFVHYDEQIMFLHVYWPFCQMVHQAFQDCSAWVNCLRESVD